MEKTIYLQRRENDSNLQHLEKYAHILDVLLRIPRVVSLRLKKIQRDFLWGEGALERKPHLVKRDTVCLDKRKGGLGVRRLSTLNRALLCKWN